MFEIFYALFPLILTAGMSNNMTDLLGTLSIDTTAAWFATYFPALLLTRKVWFGGWVLMQRTRKDYKQVRQKLKNTMLAKLQNSPQSSNQHAPRTPSLALFHTVLKILNVFFIFIFIFFVCFFFICLCEKIHKK